MAFFIAECYQIARCVHIRTFHMFTGHIGHAAFWRFAVQTGAMARGLMSDPKLLIIDEPSLGLAPVVVNELFEIRARLKDGTRTIILVEQNTQRAVGVADHVYLMQGGKVVLSEPAHDVDLGRLNELYFAR
jgi:ABC-type branched-subunit amino acid transport system ATPase component